MESRFPSKEFYIRKSVSQAGKLHFTKKRIGVYHLQRTWIHFCTRIHISVIRIYTWNWIFILYNHSVWTCIRQLANVTLWNWHSRNFSRDIVGRHHHVPRRLPIANVDSFTRVFSKISSYPLTPVAVSGLPIFFGMTFAIGPTHFVVSGKSKETTDQVLTEDILIKTFNTHFVRRKEFGNEYFEGDTYLAIYLGGCTTWMR